MKRILLAASAVLALTATANAQGYGYGTGSNSSHTRVDGYTRSNGTYVAPYARTNPDATQYNNYNTLGNYNHHNGQVGTRSPRY